MNENNARKILSKNLQRLMNQHNIDQKELAEAIGVSQPTVSNWIQQTKYPRIKKIQQLADYFNVPKSSITEDKDKTFKPQTIAPHIEGDDLTKEEWDEVLNYIEYVKQKRNK